MECFRLALDCYPSCVWEGGWRKWNFGLGLGKMPLIVVTTFCLQHPMAAHTLCSDQSLLHFNEEMEKEK